MRRFLAVVPLALFVAGCAAQEDTPTPPPGGRQVLEAYVAAWNSHDSTAFDTLLAPDGIHEDIAQNFRGGAAQTKEFLRAHIASMPDFKWALTDVFESGSQVAAEWTWTATYTGESPSGPVTGFHGSTRGSSIVEIENGRIKRFTDYWDLASYFRPAAKDSAAK